MSWFHRFLLIFGFVLLVSVPRSVGSIPKRPDSSGQSSPADCNCCKNAKVWELIAYSKALVTWIRSKMADAGMDAAHYQKLDYLNSFEYKYLVYKSKFQP